MLPQKRSANGVASAEELHLAERRGAGHCGHGAGRNLHERQGEIAVVERERSLRRHPGGERDRKGGLQKGATDERRIEEVVPQPAPGGLAQSDRHEATERRHPERQRRRQDEPDEDAGDHRREVGQLRASAERPIGGDAGGGRGQDHQQRRQAEKPETGGGRRREGDQHVAHDARRRDLRPQERRRLHDELRIGRSLHGFGLAPAAACSRRAPLATRISCTIGIPEGQA